MASQPLVAEAGAPASEADTSAPVEQTANMLYQDDQPAPVDDAPEQIEGEPAAEEGAETDQPEAAEEPAIDAPNSWSAADKDMFAGLPREAQQVIQRRETERDKFVQQKSQEAAQTRQAVEAQARDILVQVQRGYAQQLAQYAQRLAPQEPDTRLLQAGNTAEEREHYRTIYFQQEAEYRQHTAQHQQAQREATEAQQQAEALETHARKQEIAAEAQRLSSELPEWSDPSSRAKLLSDLESIGGELGYPAELMREASATDILALKRAHEWKAKAERWDKLQRDKKVPVRAARQLPKIVQPGTASSGGQQQPISVAAALYPNDVR